jgi:hypothetical protein
MGAACGAVVLLLQAVSVDAAARPRPLRFSTPRELPNAGLRVPLPEDAEESPLPSPRQHPFRVTDGKGERIETRFDPVELWRQRQVEGAWTVPGGCRFVIAVVRSEPPSRSAGLLPRAACDQLVREAPAPGSWSVESLSRWLSAFADAPPGRLDPLTSPASVHEAWRATMEPANLCAIVFRPFVGSSLRRVASTNLYVACAILPDSRDLPGVSEALSGEFLTRVSAFRPMASDDKATATARFQNRRVWDGADATAELEASRKQAAESIRNLKDWWSVDTPHFVLLSNLSARNRNGVRLMQTHVEGFRDAFEKALPPLEPIRAVSVIRIPATDAEYDAYVGPDYRWTSGLWMSHRRELVVRPVLANAGNDAQDRFLRIVVHEAFHQYLDAALCHTAASAWFNEGHAALFGGSSLDRDRVIVGESPEYAALLEPAARNGRLDVSGLMRASYEQFYRGSKDELAGHYALAWGLVYYLQKSARHDTKSACRDLLTRYLQEIAAGRDGDAATAGVLAEVPPATINQEMNAFWNSHSRRQKARGASLIH